MKLLRNPVVVVVLVVAAVALLLNSLRPVLWRSGATSTPESPAVTIPSAPAPVSANVQPGTAATGTVETSAVTTPVEQTDWSELSNKYANWTAAPKRDPFHIRNSGTNEVSDAATLLMLNAIWRSSASTLAVINDHVVATNDTIQGYQIESIEPDGVWVLGPDGREELHFKLWSQPAQADIPESTPDANSKPTAP